MSNPKQVDALTKIIEELANSVISQLQDWNKKNGVAMSPQMTVLVQDAKRAKKAARKVARN